MRTASDPLERTIEPSHGNPRPGVTERPTFLVHRLNAELGRICNPQFRRLNVDLITARILAILLERQQLPMGELVTLMSLPQSTVSHQIRRLSERGLVERNADPSDQRAFVLNLSEAGYHTARQCEAISARVYHELFADYPPAAMTMLRQALGHMHQRLAAMSPLDDQPGSA